MRTFRSYLIPRLVRLALVGPLVAVAGSAVARAEPGEHAPARQPASIVPNIAPDLAAAARAQTAPPAPKSAPASAPAAPVPAPAGKPVAPPVAAARKPAAPEASIPGATGAPSFEVIDRGNAVEVIAHNVKAARTAILPLRQRLQVPIVGMQTAKRIMPGDATVKLVELENDDATHVLSVKLGFERPDVKTLARFAQAIQVGDDLHVIVPRKVPADGVAPRLPEPTLSPALAAAVARADRKTDLKQDAVLGPSPNPAAPPPAAPPPVKPVAPGGPQPAAPIAGPAAPPPMLAGPKPAAPIAGPPAPPAGPAAPPAMAAGPAAPGAVAPAATVDPSNPPPVAAVEPARPAAQVAAAIAEPTESETKLLGPEPEPHHDARPAPPHHDARTKLSQTLAPAGDDSWSKIAMLGALGLAAAGTGVWMTRRRRLNIPPNVAIEILAQRSLGGKARLVWLSAGPHEMLVAVTAQQVNLISQWPRTTPEGAPADATFAGSMAHALGTPHALGPAYGAGFGFPAAMATAAPASGNASSGDAGERGSPPLPRPRARTSSGSFSRRPTEPPSDALPEPVIDVVEISTDVFDRQPADVDPGARARRTASIAPAIAATVHERARRFSDGPSSTTAGSAVAGGTPSNGIPHESGPLPRPAIVLPPVPAEARARRASLAATRPEVSADAEPAPAPLSPAVDGILRLRKLTSQTPIVPLPTPMPTPTPDDDDVYRDEPADVADAAAPMIGADVASGDPEADQQWIKDILAATGGQA